VKVVRSPEPKSFTFMGSHAEGRRDRKNGIVRTAYVDKHYAAKGGGRYPALIAETGKLNAVAVGARGEIGSA